MYKKILLITTLFFIMPFCASANECTSKIEQGTNNNAQIETKYIKTINLYDESENLIDTASYTISAEEYNLELTTNKEFAFLNRTVQQCDVGHECKYETEYKQLTLYIDTSAIIVLNHWKKIPKIKHYDTIGFVYVDKKPSFISDESFEVLQCYDGEVIRYDHESQNRKSSTIGESLVTNIVNDVESSLDIQLYIFTSSMPLGMVINASYQHAVTTNLSADQAKSYRLGTSANNNETVLGGTFVYSNTLISKYDQTQGVTLTYSPF